MSVSKESDGFTVVKSKGRNRKSKHNNTNRNLFFININKSINTILLCKDEYRLYNLVQMSTAPYF